MMAFLILVELMFQSAAFHDCVQSRQRAMKRRRQRQQAMVQERGVSESSACAGGICAGMTNGPHQGGNASYPVAWNGTAGTRMEAIMTVPDLPLKHDGITYYVWTDIFFGDESLGRMNQLVPQLVFGSALDATSGPPDYIPQWHTHTETWMFGAHYFFEILNITTLKIDGHAAYGNLHPAYPGETIRTTFELVRPQGEDSSTSVASVSTASPSWMVTMQVVGDPSRTSILDVKQPYMGIGARWKDPTTSWLEHNYKNMCLNACWELYGAIDLQHLPSSGAIYNLTIQQPLGKTAYPNYDFKTWERDEGNGECPSITVQESHTNETQHIDIEIFVDGLIR